MIKEGDRMNIKRKNKNGFTLVELVVVMAIFGMILSCILNFMKPANDVHNDVQATMDANVISSGLIEYIDDEIRYASNVLVLQDFIGVPEVSDKGYVGEYKVPFTNCLMIDNVHFRGYSTKNYSGSSDDTDAKKVGATGCVIKVNKLDEDGFDLNNSSVVKGDDFYDKFKFIIKVGTNIINADEESEEFADLAKSAHYDPSLKSIQISMETSYPVWKNGHYEFKKKFDRGSDDANEAEKTKNRGAVINFTNINYDKHDSKKSLTVFKCPPMNPTQALNYSAGKGYPAATSAPAGSTSQQQEYYGTGASRYTYIFYTKGNAEVTDTGCTLKFVTDTPVANTEVASPVTGFTKGETFKDFPSAPTVPGYSSSYWCAPDGTKVDEATGYVVKGDSTFKLVYVKDPDVVMHKVTWIDADGSSEVTEVPEGRTATHGAPSKFDPSKKAINESTGGWVQQGTGKTLDQVPIENDSVVFVADLVDKYPVHFKFSDSKTVDIEPVVKGKFATAPGETPEAPSGKQFDKWVLQGDESKDISKVAINAETTFVPKFIEKKSGLNSPSKGITPTFMWTNVVKYEVVIVNNTSAPVSDWRLQLTFPSGMSYNSCQDWRVQAPSNMGNKVALVAGTNAWDKIEIPAGGSVTIPVLVNCPGANDASSIGSKKLVDATVI